MESKTLISVIVPSFNHEEFISDCLESMIQQTYKNIEIVVGDDCSTDNSWEIIKSYRKKLEDRFSNVILFHNEENLGITANLNKMLKVCHGEYIKMASGDDFFCPDCIEKMLEYALDNPSLGVIWTNGYVVPEDSHPDNVKECEAFYKIAPQFQNDKMVEQLYKDNFIFALSVMYKRSLVECYGYYNEDLKIDDWDMWLRLATNHIQFGYLDEKLVYYRKNGKSITSLENNSALENKRMGVYKSSIFILMSYRNYVEEKIWIEKILQRMMEEYKIALKFHFNILEKAVRNDFKSFDGWSRVSMWTKIKYKRRMHEIKKNIK